MKSPDLYAMLMFVCQMEFCEKSTLRTCIDMGLFEDTARVWRLFREVVEGLVHIHDQGIIHRDLKPVNIFLDVNDQVKIGDFGLATTDIISRLGVGHLCQDVREWGRCGGRHQEGEWMVEEGRFSEGSFLNSIVSYVSF